MAMGVGGHWRSMGRRDSPIVKIPFFALAFQFFVEIDAAHVDKTVSPLNGQQEIVFGSLSVGAERFDFDEIRSVGDGERISPFVGGRNPEIGLASFVHGGDDAVDDFVENYVRRLGDLRRFCLVLRIGGTTCGEGEEGEDEGEAFHG